MCLVNVAEQRTLCVKRQTTTTHPSFALQTVSVTVSVLTLTFISLDRWYAICFPLRYVSTNKRAVCSIAFIWIVALLSGESQATPSHYSELTETSSFCCRRT